MNNSTKYVYRFGEGSAEGNKNQKELLGGKGANLAEMSAIGLPVPPGFTISTQACQYAIQEEFKWPQGLEKQIVSGIDYLEKVMEAGFGDTGNPLLVSVRSGAAISMPGMMDTILNLGINDDVVEGLARKSGNERFAYDTYRRFIDMFGDVVMGVKHEHFEQILEKLKKERSVELDTELDAQDLRQLTDRYKAIYRKYTGYMFPEEPMEQLRYAINAVFRSWNSSRAVKYRQISNIKGLRGTAVNVQAMVYGNMGSESATGVCFTRNPADGKPDLYGEFLVNAQGEDVVAGIRTPMDISELEKIMPTAYERLADVTKKLESHYQNMQDIEFTIQEGRLFILQTRNGKRTGKAAIRIAVDMVRNHITDYEKAIRELVEPDHINQLLHPQLSEEEVKPGDIIGRGLPASPGAGVGKVVFDSQQAEDAFANGEKVILVRIETSPEDVGGMSSAEGILTSRGGMTSHAAVVARGWGKPCVAGCGDIVINYETQSFTNGETTIKAGDWISIDGSQGLVIRGKKTMIQPVMDDSYKVFMGWITEYETMEVRANADTPDDARMARSYGARGIGLTRTEHMFFKEDRITAMRRMIIAGSEHERREVLDQLLPYQREDFVGIFDAMEGLPVTIRLLDPPLHEFLPQQDNEIREVARELNIPLAKLKAKIEQLKEFNPMLGHRGCRLGITFPEITEMQTRAIMEAAVKVSKRKKGRRVIPEVMVPLVGSPEEFLHQRKLINATAQKVFDEKGITVPYKVGTMIEVPRAALLADKIAGLADFFSFGTNDLTQMTYGYSRDDAVKFLPQYLAEGILPQDPFQVLDREGVGQLIEMGVKKGRSKNPVIKLGICGEHGGDPSSIEFCYGLGLDYVSCSPFRVPVARLAAVQARLKRGDMDTRGNSANKEDMEELHTQ